MLSTCCVSGRKTAGPPPALQIFTRKLSSTNTFVVYIKYINIRYNNLKWIRKHFVEILYLQSKYFFDGRPITSTACLVCLCTVYSATAATATQGYTLYIFCPYKTRGMDLSNHQLIVHHLSYHYYAHCSASCLGSAASSCRPDCRQHHRRCSLPRRRNYQLH